MYTLVRRFIKTGVGFLLLSLLLGLHMLVQRELRGRWPNPYLTTAHAHGLLIGFVMFLILGVALWLFPRPERDDPRYRPERIALAYWILTLSTVARFTGEIARAYRASPWIAWLVLAAGFTQVAGFVIYFWTMWPRIRPLGSRLREEKGERF